MSAKKVYDIPGDAMGSAVMHQRMLLKSGQSLHNLAYGTEHMFDQGVRIRRITFKCGGDPRGSWLVIITVVTAEGPLVAFHNGEGLLSAVEGLAARIRNGSLKWKEDEYAD